MGDVYRYTPLFFLRIFFYFYFLLILMNMQKRKFAYQYIGRIE